MRLLRPLLILFAGVLMGPSGARGQLLFDWPIRADLRPEGILVGAVSLLWNPGGFAPGAAENREIWIAHVDGPDVTGVRGLAGAGTWDLPLGLRGGLGYWHLGIPDIHRTTDSPLQGLGTIEVAEDVLILGLAGDLHPRTGMGGSLRLQRASVAGDSRSQVEGDLGIRTAPELPFSPHFGLAIRGLGGETSILVGAEAGFPPLAKGRLPIRIGYGFERERASGALEQRLSFRASWMGQIHAGFGLTHWGEGDGWTPLWMLGLDLGRYTFSVLREELANHFGPSHYYRASVRLPDPGTSPE